MFWFNKLPSGIDLKNVNKFNRRE